MIRPFFVWLAPLGCVLMLLFTSLTPFRMMTLIGEMMRAELRASTVSFSAPLSGIGPVIFGLGMLFLALLRRKPSMFARTLLLLSALMMVVGAGLNLFGDWVLMSSFQELATATSIDQEDFIGSFRPAKFPVLMGYALLFVATICMTAAATMMENNSRRARAAFVIAAISFAILLLAVFWSHTSTLRFSDIVAQENVEPAALAVSVNSVLRSDFLLQMTMLGFAISTLMVAFSRRKERTRN